MTWTWTIGILLCIAGAIITSLGMALQKYAHSLNAQRPAHEQRHYVWLPRWWAGFVCFVFGQLATVMSLGFGSEAVLSSLGSVALVTNAFFAWRFFKERFRVRDMLATGLIMLGAVVVVLFSAHADQNYSVEELKQYFRQVGFIVWAGVLGLVLLACFVHLSIQSRKGRKSSPLAYALVSAIVGAVSFTMGKCTMLLLRNTIDGHRDLEDPASFAIVSVFVAMAGSNVHFLNMGLRSGDALVVVPVYYTLNLVLCAVSGIVYFNELSKFDPLQAALFLVGIAITCTGVFVLAYRPEPQAGEVEEDDESSTAMLVPGEDLALLHVPSLPMVRNMSATRLSAHHGQPHVWHDRMATV